MRLEQKYFIPFIAVCGLLTLIVIIYGTISYSGKQKVEFRENIASVKIDSVSFDLFSLEERLVMEELHDNPVIIHFWTTWSDRSLEVNQFLDRYKRDNPELIVVAAIVRDGDEQVQEYLDQQNHDFIVVQGTALFQSLLIPGVPSQILVRRDGTLFDTQVGDDITTLENLLNSLLQDG